MKELSRYQIYYALNREKRKADTKRRYKLNPEYFKNWNKTNKDKCLIAKRKSDRKRRLDPTNRVNASIRSAIHKCLHGDKGGISWPLLVGYTIDDLKEHLEKQFDENMNWDNYGKYWHIDHIRPISGFNIKSYKDFNFKECWKLSNLRPLEAIYNIKKGKLFEVSYDNFIRFV